jgi:predicted methyltransferase
VTVAVRARRGYDAASGARRTAPAEALGASTSSKEPRMNPIAILRARRLGLGAFLSAAMLAGPFVQARAAADAPPAPAAPMAAPAPLPDYKALLADPVRTEEDRKADERRKPADLLRFAQVRAGMNVLDLSAGGGYTTQLLALAVGPGGNVWAQSGKPRPDLEKRLVAHPQANIHPLVRAFTDPYPAEAPRLDLITFILNYHDIVNAPVDRGAMNRKLFEALKPGGHLVVVDHSAQAGSGLRDTKTLHRIDEQSVVDELQQAGFKLEARGDFLRLPGDPRTQAFFDIKDEMTDRFALRLLRP